MQKRRVKMNMVGVAELIVTLFPLIINHINNHLSVCYYYGIVLGAKLTNYRLSVQG
jgi:hypothetical protein